MKQAVLIFSGVETHPLVGIWRPHHVEPWVTHDVMLGRESGPALLKATLELLHSAGETWLTITHVGVMHGPASYTKLRIFITTASTIAWVRNIPIFSFGPSALLPDDISHLVMGAKRNQAVEAVYPHDLG
jgi:tRNA A37 threonylcarbamoyladenosine modification protein TsaB